MALEYKYMKTKIPKTHSIAYPFNKTQVDAALSEEKVNELERLTFCSGRKDGSPVVLHGSLFGESRRGYWKKQEPGLTIYAVPQKDLQWVRNLCREQRILSRMARWIASLENAPNVVRDVTRTRFVYYGDGELIVKDEKGKKVGLP